jgi:sulfide dehydrogenase [flavocytochrome c] flavoprotein subunit
MKRRFGRRTFLTAVGAAGALTTLRACARPAKGQVIVVGGGFGGAACAKYITRIDPDIDVVLVERNRDYVTCPFSNNVIGGLRTLESITHSYDRVRVRVTVVHDTVTALDPEAGRVTLAGGERMSYDRLVLSPGIELLWDAVEGYDEAAAELMPHAWKAGPQTKLLRDQLAAMEDGGLVVIAAPDYPYRCPPAPYERACMIAHYLKTHGKARSKVLILDAKDSFSKQKLFEQGWARFYPGMIEWVPAGEGGKVARVDTRATTVHAGAGAFKADVANVVPPQSAGSIAVAAGLVNRFGWCEIDPSTFESTVHSGVHVIGDSCVAGAMPKSGFAANSQAKICAAAIVEVLNGRPVAEPVYMNTCYSTIAPDYGISIYGAYRSSVDVIVAVTGSVSESPLEYRFAQGWYDSITAEMFG